MGKSTISMAIFNSKLLVYQGMISDWRFGTIKHPSSMDKYIYIYHNLVGALEHISKIYGMSSFPLTNIFKDG